jgi:hypothetical protein
VDSGLKMQRKNVAILKKYGNKLKLTLCNSLGNYSYENTLQKTERGKANTEKLDCNLSRAKGVVFEYASCNPWELFGTFTIDSKKHPRDDLNGFYKKYAQWLRDYKKKYNLNIKYLNIPEMHADEINWHMHGIIHDLPMSHLKQFKEGDKSENGKPIKKSLWEKGYYYWPEYMKKFGFCSFGNIRNLEKTAGYLIKYITKDMSKSVKELNAKSYYCSTGLKKAEELKRGYLSRTPLDSEFDYVGDYTKINWYDYNDLHWVDSLIIPFETL